MHKASGELMPESNRKAGYSHWNPGNLNSKMLASLGVPRLLHSYKQAKNCINAWAAYPNAEIKFDVSSYGTERCGLNTKDDGRKKEDLVVVELYIKVNMLKGENDE